MSGVPASDPSGHSARRCLATGGSLRFASGRGRASPLAFGVLASEASTTVTRDVMHHCPACECACSHGLHVEWGLKNARCVGVGPEEQPWNS